MWIFQFEIIVCIFQYFLLNITNPLVAATSEEGVCEAKGCNSEDDRRQTEQQSSGDSIHSTGMEWRSSGNDNDDLISQLKRGGIIKSERVEQAMRRVDRGHFSPVNPYQDSPQLIGYGVTISAPHMHAHALEMLKDKLEAGSKALDVGSGRCKLRTSQGSYWGIPRGVCPMQIRGTICYTAECCPLIVDREALITDAAAPRGGGRGDTLRSKKSNPISD